MRIMMKSAKVALMAVLSVLAVSCKDTDVFDPDGPLPGGDETSEKVANTFDFSTIQNVNLSVDYSAFKLYGPVQFSVYNQNPFVGEDEFEQLDLLKKLLGDNFAIAREIDDYPLPIVARMNTFNNFSILIAFYNAGSALRYFQRKYIILVFLHLSGPDNLDPAFSSDESH